MAKEIIINGHYFEEIQAESKRGRSMIDAYRFSTKTLLSECYKKPSSAKKRAYYACTIICEDVGGTDCRITGYSCHTFSFAFVLSNSALVYITKDHSYIII